MAGYLNKLAETFTAVARLPNTFFTFNPAFPNPGLNHPVAQRLF